MNEQTTIALLWDERLNAISVNPDMATREDIAKMASELSDLRASLATSVARAEKLLREIEKTSLRLEGG